MSRLGLFFASLGLSANFWTMLSLATSTLAGAMYAMPAVTPAMRFPWFYASISGSILLLISGFFDIIDGNVARVTRQSSKKGAFLDSSLDKLAEAIVFIGIAAGSLADPLLCMIALSLSITVSYVRARAESLNIQLKGIGIGERAERLLIIAVMGLIPIAGIMQWAVIAVSVISGITLIQRIIITLKML
jgi:archaetidylinositol phosphate synthase